MAALLAHSYGIKIGSEAALHAIRLFLSPQSNFWPCCHHSWFQECIELTSTRQNVNGSERSGSSTTPLFFSFSGRSKPSIHQKKCPLGYLLFWRSLNCLARCCPYCWRDVTGAYTFAPSHISLQFIFQSVCSCNPSRAEQDYLTSHACHSITPVAIETTGVCGPHSMSFLTDYALLHHWR